MIILLSLGDMWIVPPESLDVWASRRVERTPKGAKFYSGKISAFPVSFIGPKPLNGEPWSDGTVSGRISYVLPHPTDPNVVYIAAAGGGVWKTTDGGNTWVPLTDNLPTLFSGALAFEPGNPNVIYYGTGELHYCGVCFPGDGLFKSTDGGTTWTKIATTSEVGSYISRIWIRPDNPNVIFVSGNNGLARSTDGGSTWSYVFSVNDVNSIVVRSDNYDIMFIGVYGYGVYRSTDGGSNWTRITSLPTSGIGRVELAISESNPNIIYASFASSSGGLYGLYKSTDGGTTWTRITTVPDYLYPQEDYDHTIIIHPTNPNIVFAGGVYPYNSSRRGLVRTTNGGSTWQDITDRGSNGTLHPDIHHLAFGPGNILYVACDGGIWKSYDNGDSWINLNQNLAITQFYTIDMHPLDTGLIIGGTQDNGTPMYFRNWGVTWEEVEGGDGGPVLWRPDNPSYFYTTYVYFTYLTRWRWTGSSFIYDADVSGPWDWVDNACWACGPLKGDNGGSTPTLFAGTYRVWKSTDGGNSWSAISGDLSSGGYLTAMDVSPDMNVIYTGSNNADLYVSLDGGSTWIPRSIPGTSGWEDVRDIWINPTNPNEIYIVLRKSGSYRVLHSLDAGQSWTDITSNLSSLTDAWTWSLAVDFSTTPHTIFVGAEDGLYISTDGGSTYFKETGIPNVLIQDLDVDTITKTLVVATHGRGVWKVYYGTTTRLVERGIRDVIVLKGFSKVYSVDGRLVFNGKGQIRLKKGVYMVVSGNRVRKVIIR